MAKITIEVAYATPEKQRILTLSVEQGTSVVDAAKASGIDKEFPEIDWASAKMGIFGKASRSPEKDEVKAGDRIEVYRPLLIDPKQARKNRAEPV